MHKYKLVILLICLITCFLVLIFRFLTPVKIGVILSVDTATGYEENLAIHFWRNKFPRIGLRPVLLVVETPKLGENEFKESYERLVKKGVSVIVGGALSVEGVILAKLSERYDVPTFGITTATTLLNGRKDNYYRLMTPADIEAIYTSIYLSELGIKRLLIIVSKYNKEFSQTYADHLKERMGTCDIVFSRNELVLKKLASFKPDGVFMILPSAQVSILSKIIRNFDEGIKLFSSPWGRTLTFKDLWTPSLNGLEYITIDTPNFIKYGDLAKEFEKTYSIPAGIGTGYAFSTMGIVYEAIEKVGTERKKLIEYFNTPRIYDTTYGKVYMDEYGDPVMDSLYILRIENGEVVQIGRRLVDEFYKKSEKER